MVNSPVVDTEEIGDGKYFAIGESIKAWMLEKSIAVSKIS